MSAGGGCGCSQSSSLIYNFSIEKVTLDVNLSGLSQKQEIYINVQGSYDTININVTGCRGGGSLNVSVKNEFDQVNFINSASSISSTFAIYENHDGYSAKISGSSDTTSTTFATADHGYCPVVNTTLSKDTYSVSLSGHRDSQWIVWANGNGYSTSPNRLNTAGWDSVTFENSSSFSCYWSIPAPSTCHHGYGPQVDLIAAPRE
ncbi:MAG: hypothetical protein WB947_04505 [Thermoplasmata archaeon]